MADWDTRYREGVHSGTGPHELVARFQAAIPHGTVIDIAAGRGRDILFLAGLGYRACGLERSAEALKIMGDDARSREQRLLLVQGDASSLPFRKGSASGVIVFYFLLRDIMGQLVDLLEKGGILIYETYLKRQNMLGRGMNPAYLLEDGELLSCFRDLELLFYEEIVISGEGKARALARYVGRKR